MKKTRKSKPFQSAMTKSLVERTNQGKYTQIELTRFIEKVTKFKVHQE